MNLQKKILFILFLTSAIANGQKPDKDWAQDWGSVEQIRNDTIFVNRQLEGWATYYIQPQFYYFQNDTLNLTAYITKGPLSINSDNIPSGVPEVNVYLVTFNKRSWKYYTIQSKALICKSDCKGRIHFNIKTINNQYILLEKNEGYDIFQNIKRIEDEFDALYKSGVILFRAPLDTCK